MSHNEIASMPDLYLIAHKVRGEPAFDVAERVKCPICDPIRQGLDISSPGCDACDHEGHWWIIPTSGHRAYPYWFLPLKDLTFGLDPMALSYQGMIWKDITDIEPMPSDLRDHYEVNCEPRETRPIPSGGKPKLTEIDLADLGL